MGSKIENGQYVREYYQVPAHKGQKITWRGRPARILGFDLAYLRVELLDVDPLSDQDSEIVVHPTWEVCYPEQGNHQPPQGGHQPQQHTEHQKVEYAPGPA